MQSYQQSGYDPHRNTHHQQSTDSGVITEWTWKSSDFGTGYFCGKVTSDQTGRKIFVDARDFTGGDLYQGDRISFTVKRGQRGSKAINISKQPAHNPHNDDMKQHYQNAPRNAPRNAPHNAPRNAPRNAGVLYFQTGFYDQSQMKLIQKKFGGNHRKGPKILFGDNYTDRFRRRNAKREQFAGQSTVMGHYDTTFGFGIPTTFRNTDQFHFNAQSFDALMAKLFSELSEHLRKGGDVIIPYPSKKDLQTRPQKYFKSKMFGFAKSDQLIFHNLGTGISPLTVNELMIIQRNIDNLKRIARKDVIVNQVLYNNDSNYNQSQYDYGHSPNPKPGGNAVGGVFFQTEWYTKEQLQHIENKYTVQNGPIMLFNDNETDKKRWRMSNRSDFGGMATVMGKYDRTYAYGITTIFKGGYTPPIQHFQKTIDSEFKAIMEYLMNGRDVVIPAPSAKDVQRDQHKYYRHGRQEIFHNLGGLLPPNHVGYIQKKVSELKRIAHVDKVVDYYDFSAARTYRREQRQQQYGSKSTTWECVACYKSNPMDAMRCRDCNTSKMQTYDEKANEKQMEETSPRRRRRKNSTTSSDEESEDSGLDENEIRKRWVPDNEVEVYSKGQEAWFKGIILKVGRDQDGEFLGVQYTVNDKTRSKDVGRYAYAEVRPIKKEKKKKANDIMNIDVDQLGIDDQKELLRRFEEQNTALRLLLQKEQMTHEHALKSAELEQIAERNRLKMILNGKELKIKGLEHEMSREEIEREKRKIEQQAEWDRRRQQEQMQKERANQKKQEKALKAQIKKLQSFADETGVSVCWEWEDDNNKWTPFEDNLMQQLNDIQVGRRGMLWIQGQQYEVTRTTKDSATQKSTRTNATRECRRRIVVAQQISWEWQENPKKWNQYSDDITKAMEKLNPNSNNNKYTYTFAKNNQTYEITRQGHDFGVQINTKTNVSRKVRRIKSGDDGTNIYPHFWDLTKIKKYDQAEIVEVKLTDPVAQEVIKKFNKTSQKKVVKLEAIMNQCLFDRYTHERDMMLKLKQGDKAKLNEKELYHGTKTDSIVDVVKMQGFRKEFTTKAYYGEGTYFARDAKYSVSYSSPLADGVTFRMFVCKVLCGESHKGTQAITLKTWPQTAAKTVVDSLCNDVNNPSIWVMHQDSKIYPMWIVYFQ